MPWQALMKHGQVTRMFQNGRPSANVPCYKLSTTHVQCGKVYIRRLGTIVVNSMYDASLCLQIIVVDLLIAHLP
jgi:hypothetical protein